MSNIREIHFSCDIFSYYKTTVDLDECESIKDVIKIAVKSLSNTLIKNNFESLHKKLMNINYHIHDYTFEDMLINDPKVYYICNHKH